MVMSWQASLCRARSYNSSFPPDFFSPKAPVMTPALAAKLQAMRMNDKLNKNIHMMGQKKGYSSGVTLS